MGVYRALDIRRIEKNAEAVLSLFNRVSGESRLDHTSAEIDNWIARELSRLGLRSSLLKYKGYPANTCFSPNDIAAHGIPNERKIVRGDIFTIDVAATGGGWMSDSAWTFVMPGASERARRTVDAAWFVTRAVLNVVRAGVTVREIAETAENAAGTVDARVIPDFAGHGIGRAMHERPRIPFSANGTTGVGGFEMREGEVISIEPVVTLGDEKVVCDAHGWNCRTEDGSPTAHFELTVAVVRNGCRVLGFGGIAADELPKGHFLG